MARTWVNGQSPAINADNLNGIESDISANAQGVFDNSKRLLYKGKLSTTLPVDAVEGDLYLIDATKTYGSISAKVGDIIIKTSSGWDLVPSGNDGGIQSISAGNGITISGTNAKTVEINNNYTASSSRNGLMSSADYVKLAKYPIDIPENSNFSAVAFSGEYSDIFHRPAEHHILNAETKVIDSNAYLTPKAVSDSIDDVQSSVDAYIPRVEALESHMPKVSGNIVDAADSTHIHGNITNEGKIGSQSDKILVTGVGGSILTTDSISSDKLNKPFGEDDYIVGVGVDAVNISLNDRNTEDILSHLPTDEELQLVDVSAKEHEHDVFLTEEIDIVEGEEVQSYSYKEGFVPIPEDEEKILCSTGWEDTADTVVQNEKNEFITYATSTDSSATLGELRVIVLDHELSSEEIYEEGYLYLIKA